MPRPRLTCFGSSGSGPTAISSSSRRRRHLNHGRMCNRNEPLDLNLILGGFGTEGGIVATGVGALDRSVETGRSERSLRQGACGSCRVLRAVAGAVTGLKQRFGESRVDLMAYG